MAQQPDDIRFICPRCGAANRTGAATCFLCGQRVDPSVPASATDRTPPPVSPRTLADPYAPPTAASAGRPAYRLDSLLLVIALIAVCMGVIHEAPGLGIPLAVVSFIALSRTAFLSSSTKGQGRPLSVGDKLAVFFATVGMALMVLICVVIAIFATCYAICAVAAPSTGVSDLSPLGTPLTLILAVGLVWGMIYLARRLGRVRSIRRDEPDAK